MRKILTPPLQALLRHECVSSRAEISLVLCDDDGIRALNSQYRRIDKATDVLSFPQDDPELLGDIVISLMTAERQAAMAGWPLGHEMALLAVHGLLHLLGYDDATIAGAVEMREKTRLALVEAGITPPVEEGVHPYFVEYPAGEDNGYAQS